MINNHNKSNMINNETTCIFAIAKIYIYNIIYDLNIKYRKYLHTSIYYSISKILNTINPLFRKIKIKSFILELLYKISPY